MAEIRMTREHQLGLEKARKIAWQWAEQCEQEFGMACTGVNGTLRVAADRFDLEAKLGFLLGAFAKTIEAEIEKNLDALLAQAPAAKKAARKAAAKKG